MNFYNNNDSYIHNNTLTIIVIYIFNKYAIPMLLLIKNTTTSFLFIRGQVSVPAQPVEVVLRVIHFIALDLIDTYKCIGKGRNSI